MKGKTNYELIDIFKLIFCIMVVSIHTNILKIFPKDVDWYVTNLLFRLAVPFFFITSGFFFGRKILSKNNNLKETTKKYCIRLSIPLVFWLLIGLPHMIYERYDVRLLHTIKELIKETIFYPYGALWYIYALLIAIIILYFFYKRKKYILPVIIGFILYIFALVCNSYYFVIDNIPILKKIVDTYMKIFVSARNGIFVGILFVSLGVLLAKYIDKIKNIKLRYPIIITIVLYLMLIVEVYVVKGRNVLDDSSIYIITPFISTMIVYLLIVLSRNKAHPKIRNLSTGIYFIHRPIIGYLLMIFPTLSDERIIFIVVLPLSIIITLLLQKSKNNFIRKVIT